MVDFFYLQCTDVRSVSYFHKWFYWNADLLAVNSSNWKTFNNFVLNPFDVARGFTAGCANGTANAGAWCYQGTANLRGSTAVPEPGTMALIAMGLLGISATRRGGKGPTA